MKTIEYYEAFLTVAQQAQDLAEQGKAKGEETAQIRTWFRADSLGVQASRLAEQAEVAKYSSEPTYMRYLLGQVGDIVTELQNL